MATNDFLTFAIGGGANVVSQATYSGLGIISTGYTSGTALSNQLNKTWRQSATWANVLGGLLNQYGHDALDNGVPATLLADLIASIRQAAGNGSVVVAFSSSPVFDCSKGTKFEITLTGNVTAPTVTNVLPGMSVTFTIKQDATGGRTWANPSGWPIDSIDTTANAVNIQKFEVDSGGIVRSSGGMVVS